MEVYTYSEARQNMAALLDKADRGECIRIRRKDGHLFELKAATEINSPLDVQGVDLEVTTEEIVGFVREGRNRYGE
ncbi:MAG: type II toxin-antitoxin system Phd/YefM family antitoxin [Verrucomicrobiota bacterium]|nr:type II toxin-antitoxin system Phd/YefM family antitoxin [Verrucomicrobiota bacterium]